MATFKAGQQAAVQLLELVNDLENAAVLLRHLAGHDTWDHVAANALAAVKDAHDTTTDVVFVLDDGTLLPAGSDDDG